MRKTLILLGFVLGLSGCSDDQSARQLLRADGYTNIETTGYSMWGCSEDDSYHTGFVANTAAGVRVKGVVCCGAFGKSCTVRRDR